MPTVLIFSDTPEGLEHASGCVDRAGGRVVARLPLEGALERLDAQLSLDLVIIDVVTDHGRLFDLLIRRLDDEARLGRFASVVVVTPSLVDVAAARLRHDDVCLIVGRDGHSLLAAVEDAIRQPAHQLRDRDDNGERARFHKLSDEMERLARVLSGEGGDGEDGTSDTGGGERGAIPFDGLTSADAAALREMIRGRRLREHFFGRGLFADPAWDILLDLTAARIERRPVAVSSLCIAAAVPATTALRWIKQLTEAGLLRRVADPGDGRRVFIELTDNAANRMMAYFGAMARGNRI